MVNPLICHTQFCQLRFWINLPELGAVTCWVCDIWWIGGKPPWTLYGVPMFTTFSVESADSVGWSWRPDNCHTILVPAVRWIGFHPGSHCIAILAMPWDARCCECTPAKCSWTTSTMQSLGVGAIGAGLKPTKPTVLRYWYHWYHYRNWGSTNVFNKHVQSADQLASTSSYCGIHPSIFWIDSVWCEYSHGSGAS